MSVFGEDEVIQWLGCIHPPHIFMFSESEANKYLLLTLLQEAQEGVLTLNEEEPETVQRMLEFIYCGDYHEPNEAASKRSEDCEMCGPHHSCNFCNFRRGRFVEHERYGYCAAKSNPRCDRPGQWGYWGG